MIHMSTIRSKIDNSSLMPVPQNGPKPQLSILKGTHSLAISKSLDSNDQNSIFFLDMFLKSYSWYSKNFLLRYVLKILLLVQ